MPLTRDAELTADVPVDDVAGAPGDLVFRLVSRGFQNAVVTIHGIVAVTAEDVDQDGLTAAFAPTGFTLQWPAQTSRKYRVLRSATPGFESYENIGQALPGRVAGAELHRHHGDAGTGGPEVFRIQLEPQP